MSIGSVSGTTGSAPVQRMPESMEANKAGRDHDGDADDRAAAPVWSAKPSANLQGQQTGQVISVTA